MKLSKLIAVGLALVMVLTLAVGCGQKAEEPAKSSETTGGETKTEAPKEEPKEKVKIGWALSNFDDKWLSYMLNAAQAKAEELTDAEVIFVDAKDDTAKQMSQIENFIAQGVDAICVIPVNSEATGPLTQACKDAGIPLISVNRYLKNQDEATSYVGSESIKAGIMQMEYIGEKLGGKGNIVILRGADGHEASENRTNGNKQVIAEKYPDIKVVAEQVGNWDRAKGMQITENWIQSGMQFDAVVSNNDEMAIGAIMALKDAGMMDKVLVAGIDATPDALEYLKEGTLACTVFQNASGQGAGSVEAAYKVAKGEKIDKEVWIPYELVKPEQYEEYMAKWN
jgi:inositol transport system substrate-binding protein